MRSRKVVLVSVTVILLLSGCRKSNISVPSVTPTESAGIEREKNEGENDTDKMKLIEAFRQIEYNQSDGEDRIALSADWVLGRFDKEPSDGTGVAICLITMMESDTEKCFEGSGTNILITIRIDQVLVSTGNFKKKNGDIIETSDFSAWMKKEGGYVVWAPEGQIPVAVEGAQYIAQVGEVTEEVMKQLPLPVGYRTHSFTIPIVDESIITREEIYNIMDLPDDVQKCSEELIEMFIR